MRISLVYHHAAGDGVSADWLLAELEQAGHELVQVVDRPAELGTLLADTTDCVVAAGGDGTISRTASTLAGRGVPLAILPLGTANNIARTLGIEGPIPELIHAWQHARRRPLDLGVARSGRGESRFLEGVGGGLIPRGISVFDGEPHDDPDEPAVARVARALRRYRDVLAHLRPRTWTMTVDGAPVVGDYLIVEVLNIRSVGPNVVLAPGADPSDGCFDVVTVGEEHRQALDAYLEQRIDGAEARVSLPTRRARRVDTEGWEEMHVDDEILAGPTIDRLSVDVDPAALDYLGP